MILLHEKWKFFTTTLSKHDRLLGSSEYIFVEIQNCMNKIDFNCSAELLKSERQGPLEKKAGNPESDHTFFQTVRRTENILSESVGKNRVEAALLLKVQRPRWQYTGLGQTSKIPPKIKFKHFFS